MYGLVLAIHVIVCLLLVIAVLLQSGKAADLAGAFGGMGSQSTFGPRGAATFLSKMTTTLAILFMVTSLSLWILAANRAASKDFVDGLPQDQTQTTQTTQTPQTDPATQPPATTDTEKATQTEDKTGQQQESEQPPAATSETKSETGTGTTGTDSQQ